MSDKSLPSSEPNVLFLQDVLDEAFGAGATKVICPITDAFVRHHGALGSFIRVWCLDHRLRRQRSSNVFATCRVSPGCWTRRKPARPTISPADREGDVVVIAEANAVIGGAAREHDLSALRDARLRSHGGVSEARVPFILSEPLNPDYRQRAASAGLKSHQIFEFAINGTQAVS